MVFSIVCKQQQHRYQPTFYTATVWKGNLDRQRRFFDEIASERGFDPVLHPEKWASVTRDDITVKHVCTQTPSLMLLLSSDLEPEKWDGVTRDYITAKHIYTSQSHNSTEQIHSPSLSLTVNRVVTQYSGIVEVHTQTPSLLPIRIFHLLVLFPTCLKNMVCCHIYLTSHKTTQLNTPI